MREAIRLSLLAAAALILVACGRSQAFGSSTQEPLAVSPTKPTAASLVAGGDVDLGASTWKLLKSVDGTGAEATIENPASYTLHFTPADGKVTIKSDCRSARGAFTAGNQTLTIKIEAMTNAICAPDSLSDLFIAQLSSVESYAFEGDELILQLKLGAGSLRFTP